MTVELDKLLTEAQNERTKHLDTLKTEEILELMNDEDRKVAQAVAKEIPQITRFVEHVVEAMKSGGRLIYLGAGTSGRLGVLDASECPPTFGLEVGRVIGLIAGGDQALRKAIEGAEDDPEGCIAELKGLPLSEKDVVVGLAASGRTPYVVGGLTYAKSIGAFTAAISCTTDSAISKVAEISITPLVGPEVITGSTRLKAGTAQKLVLNMITTATMVRLGKVYGNLMVDVQPTNDKLIARAERIVCQATGVRSDMARHVLAEAEFKPKAAIVMIERKCTFQEAQAYLTSANGFIRQALTINKEERN